MENNIDIEIKIDPDVNKTKVVVHTNELNGEVQELINKLKSSNENTLLGYKDEKGYILELEKIERIYTENKKVYANCEKEVYHIRKRIFELEDALEEYNFIRISNSEIVNFKKVKSMDFKIIGTIVLNLKSGEKTYVSRRYIKKIKEYLGI